MARAVLIAVTAVVAVLGIEAHRRGAPQLLMLDAEATLPAAWSGFLLVLAAAAALATARSQGARWPWWALALLFGFMAFDEVVGLHEWLERHTGVDWQTLYLPLMGVGAAAALVALLELRRLPQLAVGFAASGGAWAVAQALEALQWDGGHPVGGYGAMMVAEEVLRWRDRWGSHSSCSRRRSGSPRLASRSRRSIGAAAPRRGRLAREPMYQRIHERFTEPGRARRTLPRRGADAVLQLQRMIGNQRTTRVLARDKKKNEATYKNSVRVGELGPIEIKDGNLAEWQEGKEAPDVLTLTTTKGKHSDKLKKLAEGKDRNTVEVQLIVGQNGWLQITITNARVRRYSADGETESWQVFDFEAVARKRTSIGKFRPG